jgi:hypothetical protein
MPIQMVSDIIESNGKTIRENNLEREHQIPIGALVELDSASEFSDTEFNRVVRGYVVAQGRDCDGTPLYYLSMDPQDLLDAQIEMDCRHELYRLSEECGRGSEAERDYQMFLRWTSNRRFYGGFSDESLTVISTNDGFVEYLREQYRFNADDKRYFLMNIRRELAA